MTFLIAEDEALREQLKGMTVSDDKEATRPVGVWFGQPDAEIRQQSFPFVTVDLINVVEDKQRTMSAQQVSPWYNQPEELVLDNITYGDWSMYMPIPVTLMYQVTTFARQPRHDRQIIAQLLDQRLPLRYGSLVVREKFTGVVDGVDQWDSTVRRLDMVGISKNDRTESGKRMFMNALTVQVSSEVPTPFMGRLYMRVNTVNIMYQPIGFTSTIPA
jgi:hypothetical protein